MPVYVLLVILGALGLGDCQPFRPVGTGGNNPRQGAGKDRGWKFDDIGSKEQATARAATAFAELTTLDFEAAAQDKTPGSSGGRPGGQKLRAMFNDWADSFGFTYSSPQERQAAFQSFAANMAVVQQVNADPEAPFWASGNKFSGLSFEQFSGMYLMDNIGSPPAGGAPALAPGPGRKLTALPREVDWAAAGMVTPVRDQMACGSCWAFAASTAIESMYLIKVGATPSLDLSDQQLVSCVNSANGYAGYGCDGGWSDQAINYVANINQTTESRYPYTATTGSCNMAIVGSSTTGQAVKLSGSAQQVAPKSETSLMSAVVTAPTVFYFSVSRTWQSYAGGIYVDKGCSNKINHAMVAVGYSTSSSTQYWIVRNSWGTSWGESGSARIKMSGSPAGPCGMYQFAYLPPQTFVSVLA